MNLPRLILRRLRALFRGERLDTEMSEEMRAHLELQAAENEKCGMTPDAARYSALRSFGGTEQIKERARDGRGWRRIEQLGRDLAFARRSLLRSPGFSAIAVITIALGIGMNTAMFGVLNGLLLRPLGFPHSERLFYVDRITRQSPHGGHSLGDFADLARHSAGVADLAGARSWVFNVSENGRPADAPNALRVTANYFDVLGVQPELGRGFIRGEDEAGRHHVVVLGHHYWRSRYGGDPAIIGRTIRLDGAPVEIVGVMPASLDQDMLRLFAPIGLFRPYGANERERVDRKDHGLMVFGRYDEGVAPAAALARLHVSAQRLAAEFPLENESADFGPRSLQSSTLTGASLRVVWLLVGLSGFVLLIACANLANLLLARALARTREFAIRAALGASRAQLVRPLLAECLVLVATGGLLAALLARGVLAWMLLQLSQDNVTLDGAADGRVLLFMLGASALTVLLFGVGPAWWVSRLGPGDALKRGGRGGTDSPAQQRYRHLLIGAQFALALVLLSGAAFFLRGVRTLMRVDAGWEPAAVVSGSLNSPIHYSEVDRLIAWQAKLLDRLRLIPGVANAAVCFQIPLFSPPAQRDFVVDGRDPPAPGQEPPAQVNAVSADYFDTVGVRLTRGRLFDATDHRTSRPVVVINETMARTLFAAENPIGQRLGVRGKESTAWAEIVGVVADTRPMSVTPRAITFEVYKPYAQEAWQFVTIAVRAASPALAPQLVNPIRQTIAALDPDLPVLNLSTASQKVARSSATWRFIKQLLALFAGLGLFLAAFGISGVLARLVAQRNHEIGIRLALGARARDILALVLGGGMRTALVGSGVGIVGSVILAQVLTRELPVFGGNGFGPILASAALLVLVALIACFIPARRATRVDPMVALRAE